MRFGSLFSGIGGMDLGLEQAGMSCAWQVEIDKFCRMVLTKHWPNVPKYQDVRECGKYNLEQVDLITGGFPCQDLSDAGKRAGIKGKRSGLWVEFYRVICELRPRYVLVENVAALLRRGMGTVLGNLAHAGYDAEWEVLPACAFGAPHPRERVFIVAYPASGGLEGFNGSGSQRPYQPSEALLTLDSKSLDDVYSQWKVELPESYVCRVANGVPFKTQRTRALGNAVVPTVAKWIGQQIIEREKENDQPKTSPPHLLRPAPDVPRRHRATGDVASTQRQ